MKVKRVVSFVLAAVLMLTFFSGCSQSEKKKEKGPEIGKWHAEIKLSDVAGSMSEDDRMLMSMLAGNIMFEIDVEFCEDGSFTYIMNTDKLQEEISNSINKIIGFFFSYDVSLFVDRLVGTVLQDSFQSSKKEYAGKYTRSESNLITATDGDTIYFKVTDGYLIQIDDEGNNILRFTKVGTGE